MDPHRNGGDKAEFPVNDQQLYHTFVGEALHSNGNVVSPDIIGEVAGSYCPSEDYSELTYVTAPNGYLPSHGSIYTGCPSPVLNNHGYIPYQMDGLQYYNQVVDFNYWNQSLYGSIPLGVYYPTQCSDGMLYGPQVYQYPVQQYYQQPALGQYMPASPAAPPGGMVLLEPQDSSVVLANGFSSYAGPMASVPSVSYVPSISCESPALPVAVPYPPSGNSSHPLRASAPAWIESARELKGGFIEQTVVETSSGPQASVVNGIYPPLKAAPTAVNGVLSRSNSSLSAAKVVNSIHPGSGPLTTARVYEANEGDCTENEKSQKRDLSFSAVTSNGHENSGQLKSYQVSQLSGLSAKDSCSYLPNGERYNCEDFVVKYDDAKHFIIKSYSEENVFRSIQYGVWASTPNGNKKLDDAYHDAQRRAAGKLHGCPVFLYFSVNGSRQFCGVAEMIGPVDYKRSMEFWEQHKWSGSFPLKWHFIKDVPNSQFRRIILQNNENKPVTNSRDTQEVFFQQGLEMLNIIKNYPARTSILDEFSFYNLHNKAAPDPKSQQQWSMQNFPKLSDSIARVRSGEFDPKNPSLSSAPMKVGDCGAKAITATKSTDGKVSSATSVAQETSTDKNRQRVDKVNIKLSGRNGTLVAS
ncbi:hypothetical protein KP509_38G048900 [Ceratopteris richardii]|nr:hypothetical protein KP509_38G048900 [Ceratopteris richardii]